MWDDWKLQNSCIIYLNLFSLFFYSIKHIFCLYTHINLYILYMVLHLAKRWSYSWISHVSLPLFVLVWPFVCTFLCASTHDGMYSIQQKVQSSYASGWMEHGVPLDMCIIWISHGKIHIYIYTFCILFLSFFFLRKMCEIKDRNCKVEHKLISHRA